MTGVREFPTRGDSISTAGPCQVRLPIGTPERAAVTLQAYFYEGLVVEWKEVMTMLSFPKPMQPKPAGQLWELSPWS